MLKRTLCASLLALFCASTSADQPDYQNWVGGFIELYNPDSDKPNPQGYLDSGHGTGVEFGHRLDEHWAGRIEWSSLDLDVDSNLLGNQIAQDNGDRLGIDAMYFVEDDLFYIFAGLKQANYGDSHSLGNLGLGKHWHFNSKLRVISEAALYHDFGEGFRDAGVKIGLAYVFGDVKSMPSPKDSDKDGVLDAYDNCPTTAAGTKVDNQGCDLDSDNDGVPNAADNCPNTPAGVSVDSMGCNDDTDGDGVKNKLDACPNTPSGVQVGAKGCALDLDADQDGVLDSQDQCPDTPVTDKVDESGCSIFLEQEVSISMQLNFANNSAEIEDPQDPQIDAFAKFMKRFPNTDAIIEGHTSAVGAADYNKRLSGERALAVVNLLISKYKIPAQRLASVGYGEERLLQEGDSESAHAANRRIEAKVTATEKVKATKD